MTLSLMQNLAGRIDEGVHSLMVRVYHEDTDFTGVVYHANYLRFFERGRSDYLRLLGVNHQDLMQLDDPLAFAVAAMTVAFKIPARIGDVLTVKSRVLTVKSAHLVLDQQIDREGSMVCEAEFKLVCLDRNGRPRRLARALSDLLAGVAP